MSASHSRQPPRFVPTLTDVVSEQVITPSMEEAPKEEHEQTPSLPALTSLNFCAQAGEVQQATQTVEPDWTAVARELQERVLERLDKGLEERLRDMVQVHTQALYQTLYQDIERLVSVSVHEALAQELAYMQSRKS